MKRLQGSGSFEQSVSTGLVAAMAEMERLSTTGSEVDGNVNFRAKGQFGVGGNDGFDGSTGGFFRRGGEREGTAKEAAPMVFSGQKGGDAGRQTEPLRGHEEEKGEGERATMTRQRQFNLSYLSDGSSAFTPTGFGIASTSLSTSVSSVQGPSMPAMPAMPLVATSTPASSAGAPSSSGSSFLHGTVINMDDVNSLDDVETNGSDIFSTKNSDSMSVLEASGMPVKTSSTSVPAINYNRRVANGFHPSKTTSATAKAAEEFLRPERLSHPISRSSSRTSSMFSPPRALAINGVIAATAAAPPSPTSSQASSQASSFATSMRTRSRRRRRGDVAGKGTRPRRESGGGSYGNVNGLLNASGANHSGRKLTRSGSRELRELQNSNRRFPLRRRQSPPSAESPLQMTNVSVRSVAAGNSGRRRANKVSSTASGSNDDVQQSKVGAEAGEGVPVGAGEGDRIKISEQFGSGTGRGRIAGGVVSAYGSMSGGNVGLKSPELNHMSEGNEDVEMHYVNPMNVRERAPGRGWEGEGSNVVDRCVRCLFDCWLLC